MTEVLRRVCPVCKEEFETTNPRKMYCTKQDADRSRNLPAVPVGTNGLVELKHMGKFPQPVRNEVLLGKAGYKIVFYDIEATHLQANIGRMICVSFKPLGEEPYTFHALEKRFKMKDVFDDSRLAKAVRDELEKYDIIVGHNSKMFDTKYINARNVRVGERTKKPQYQVDTMWSWKAKNAAWSGLASIQKFLGTTTHKTTISWEAWMRVLGWNRAVAAEALAEIIDHCERDVRALEEVYLVMVKADIIRSLRLDGGVL